MSTTDLRLRAAHYGATLARAAIELYTPPSPDYDSGDLAAQLGGYLSLPLGPTGQREPTPPELVAIARVAYQSEVLSYLATLAGYVEKATAPTPTAQAPTVRAGSARCGCVYHAEDGVPCEHDIAQAADVKPEAPPAPRKCPSCRGRGWQTRDGRGAPWRAPRDGEGVAADQRVCYRACPTCDGTGEVTP